MTCVTQTQYPVEALDDLQKVTAFTGSYIWQYLTNDFAIKGTNLQSQDMKMTCETQTQYSVEVLDDLQKVTACILP
jgi:hypothetical protein